MSHWNKIDWYCPECGEYWMTTENCSPYSDLRCHSDCECKGSKKDPAMAKCASCHQSLEHGEELCLHVTDRSQAV